MKMDVPKEKALDAFKATNKNMMCSSNFKYEIGESYHHDGEVKICQSGFHACPRAIDVSHYKDLNKSRFFKVRQWGEIDSEGLVRKGQKTASSDIEILEEISPRDILEDTISYDMDHGNVEKEWSGRTVQSRNPNTSVVTDEDTRAVVITGCINSVGRSRCLESAVVALDRHSGALTDEASSLAGTISNDSIAVANGRDSISAAVSACSWSMCSDESEYSIAANSGCGGRSRTEAHHSIAAVSGAVCYEGEAECTSGRSIAAISSSYGGTAIARKSRSIAAVTSSGSATTHGPYSVSATAYHHTKATSKSDHSVSVTTGEECVSRANGSGSTALANGRYSQAIAEGKNNTVALATGDYSGASISGGGVAISTGEFGFVSGDLGSLLVAVEREWDRSKGEFGIKSYAAGIVDGVTLKPKGCYRCIDGKFVECDSKGVLLDPKDLGLKDIPILGVDK